MKCMISSKPMYNNSLLVVLPLILETVSYQYLGIYLIILVLFYDCKKTIMITSFPSPNLLVVFVVVARLFGCCCCSKIDWLFVLNWTFLENQQNARITSAHDTFQAMFVSMYTDQWTGASDQRHKRRREESNKWGGCTDIWRGWWRGVLYEGPPSSCMRVSVQQLSCLCYKL